MSGTLGVSDGVYNSSAKGLFLPLVFTSGFDILLPSDIQSERNGKEDRKLLCVDTCK